MQHPHQGTSTECSNHVPLPSEKLLSEPLKVSIWNTSWKQTCACWWNLFTHAVIFQCKTHQTAPGPTLTLMLHAIHPKYDIISCSQWRCYPVSVLRDTDGTITKRVHILSSTSLPGENGVTETNSSHVKASCVNVGYRCGPPSLSPPRPLAGPDKTLLWDGALILAAGDW